MTASNFDAALRLVLKHEGGYSNHPSDPGGATNFGITLAVARANWKRNATPADLKRIPMSVVADIYRSQYWDKAGCNGLPDGLDYCVFDYAVNSGVGRAVRSLRQARKSETRVQAQIQAICDERMEFLKRLRTWGVFGKGWARRVTEVRQNALAMAHTIEDDESASRLTGASADDHLTDEPCEPQAGMLAKAKHWWKEIAGAGGVGLAGIFDWRVAAVLVGGALIVFMIVWFSRKRRK